MPDSTSPNDPSDLLRVLIDRYSGSIPSLPDKPEETIEAVVRSLWLCAGGQPASAVRAIQCPLPVLSERQRHELIDLLEERSRGTPLAHLTGRQHFMGREFLCSKHALIPRRETEIVGKAALNILREHILPRTPQPRVLDLCTGSGNLACSFASSVPQCTVYAADLSEQAAELARANSRHLECKDRVKVSSGDLFSPFDSPDFYHSFDLLTCNPPYITSAKLPTLHHEVIGHEPKMAFDAGPLGLAILWRLLQDAPRFLNAGGWLAFEVGLGQGKAILRRITSTGQFSQAQGVLDSQGNIRAIICQAQGQASSTDEERLLQTTAIAQR